MAKVTEIVVEEWSGQQHTLTVSGTRISGHSDPGAESISSLSRRMELEDGREVQPMPRAIGRYRIVGTDIILKRIRVV
jgi:hypothetical protein